MKNVAIAELETGMVLAHDVIDHEGRIVYPKGRILTERQIIKLQEMGLPNIAVQDATEANLGPLPFLDDKIVPKHEGEVESRPFIRHLFQHVNLEHPLMSKLYDECNMRLPNNLVFQTHQFYQRTPQELAQTMTKMPVLPTVYFRLSELVNNPESSSADMAKVINDSGMAAVILKTVNSAQFGLTHKVDDISKAITVLGTRQLCELVLAGTVVKSFESIPQGLVSIESFSQHSLACGMFAREIANAIQQPNPERFFTAGLLHDIGRLVLFSQCQADFTKALHRARETDELLYHWERKIFGFDHGDVGAALLELWGLPEVLQEAVKYHHAPHLAPKQSIETYIIHFADIFTNALQLGTSGEHLVPPLNAQALAKLNLNPAYIPLIIDKATYHIDEILQMILPKD